MREMGRDGRDLFSARIEDAIEKSRKGSLARISFLTPRERKNAEKILRQYGVWQQAWFWGGYADAERACLFLLPDYLLCCLDESLAGQERDEALLALLSDEVAKAVCAVRIRGSGYRKLGHRDYLGSVLGLGLERDALGDIAVQNEHEAVLFCPRSLLSFLIEGLQKVGSDTVRCEEYEVDEHFTDGRAYQAIRDTVASPRLDSVVAALTNLSRDAAQQAVRGGLVEVDFEVEERVDCMLQPQTVISVRGHGRFILRSFDGETRKGRLRLYADKLI